MCHSEDGIRLEEICASTGDAKLLVRHSLYTLNLDPDDLWHGKVLGCRAWGQGSVGGAVLKVAQQKLSLCCLVSWRAGLRCILLEGPCLSTPRRCCSGSLGCVKLVSKGTILSFHKQHG